MKTSFIESDNFELKDGEVAVLYTADSVRIVTPPVDDSTVPEPHQQFAVMLAYLSSVDQEWVESVLQRFDEATADKEISDESS